MSVLELICLLMLNVHLNDNEIVRIVPVVVFTVFVSTNKDVASFKCADWQILVGQSQVCL